jgi:hypothetical protein
MPCFILIRISWTEICFLIERLKKIIPNYLIAFSEKSGKFLMKKLLRATQKFSSVVLKQYQKNCFGFLFRGEPLHVYLTSYLLIFISIGHKVLMLRTDLQNIFSLEEAFQWKFSTKVLSWMHAWNVWEVVWRKWKWKVLIKISVRRILEINLFLFYYVLAASKSYFHVSGLDWFQFRSKYFASSSFCSRRHRHSPCWSAAEHF